MRPTPQHPFLSIPGGEQLFGFYSFNSLQIAVALQGRCLGREWNESRGGACFKINLQQIK